MPMNSAEMFRLLEDIPKGSEAMITRVLHTITEKGEWLFLMLRAHYKIISNKMSINNRFFVFDKTLRIIKTKWLDYLVC